MFWVDRHRRIRRAAASRTRSARRSIASRSSPDNSMVVAYFSAAGPDDAGFFRNPNELAVIDLDEAAERRTTRRCKTIRSFGSVPEGITLSPPMVVPGARRSDAAHVRVRAVVEQPDAARRRRIPTRREISIRLDLGGTRGDPARGRVRAEHRERVRAQRQRARRAAGPARGRAAGRPTSATTSGRCSPSSAPAAARRTSRSTTIRAAGATCSRRRRTPARSS